MPMRFKSMDLPLDCYNLYNVSKYAPGMSSRYMGALRKADLLS